MPCSCFGRILRRIHEWGKGVGGKGVGGRGEGKGEEGGGVGGRARGATEGGRRPEHSLDAWPRPRLVHAAACCRQEKPHGDKVTAAEGWCRQLMGTLGRWTVRRTVHNVAVGG